MFVSSLKKSENVHEATFMFINIGEISDNGEWLGELTIAGLHNA